MAKRTAGALLASIIKKNTKVIQKKANTAKRKASVNSKAVNTAKLAMTKAQEEAKRKAQAKKAQESRQSALKNTKTVAESIQKKAIQKKATTTATSTAKTALANTLKAQQEARKKTNTPAKRNNEAFASTYTADHSKSAYREERNRQAQNNIKNIKESLSKKRKETPFSTTGKEATYSAEAGNKGKKLNAERAKIINSEAKKAESAVSKTLDDFGLRYSDEDKERTARQIKYTGYRQQLNNEDVKKASIDIAKDPLSLGLLEGSSLLPLKTEALAEFAYRRGWRDKPTDEWKNTLAETRDTGLYKGSYMTGVMLPYAIPGAAVPKAGSTIMRGAVKGAPKLGKIGSKVLNKVGSNEWLSRRIADHVLNTPLNFTQALKDANYVDENGSIKYDPKTFGMSFLLNQGGDLVLGGGLDGIGALSRFRANKPIRSSLQRSEYRAITRIMAKERNNVPLTSAEKKTKKLLTDKATRHQAINSIKADNTISYTKKATEIEYANAGKDLKNDVVDDSVLNRLGIRHENGKYFDAETGIQTTKKEVGEGISKLKENDLKVLDYIEKQPGYKEFAEYDKFKAKRVKLAEKIAQQEKKNPADLDEYIKARQATDEIEAKYADNEYGVEGARFDKVAELEQEYYAKETAPKVTKAKEEQFEIIQRSNPADESLSDHTWIRSADEIQTFDEATKGIDENLTPDYTLEMVNDAKASGKITVYSSKPIEEGAFVTPSRMEAQNYAGDDRVFSKEVDVDDVAWIDGLQGQYAKATESKQGKVVITQKMSDKERAEAISKATIEPASPNSQRVASSLKEIENLKQETVYKRAEKALKAIGQKFGITDKKYYNKNIKVSFIYSNNGIHKSATKQAVASGDYSQLAKAMSCFDEITEKAVPIEVHPDRYVGTYRADVNLEHTYVLLSAMRDGDSILPVELVVRVHKNNQENNLYVALVLDNKKKAVNATRSVANSNGFATMPSTYNISDIIQRINSKDSDFLKYFPDEMLSKEQLKGKSIGIKAEEKKLKELREETLNRINKFKNKIDNLKSKGERTSNEESVLKRLEKEVDNHRADYEADGLLKPKVNTPLAQKLKVKKAKALKKKPANDAGFSNAEKAEFDEYNKSLIRTDEEVRARGGRYVGNDDIKAIEGEDIDSISPFKDTDTKTLSSRKTKSLSSQDADYHKYYKREAEQILRDLEAHEAPKKAYGIYGEGDIYARAGVGAEPRKIADDLGKFHDSNKYTYEQIRQGAENIIKGGDAADNAISKKLEALMDERLRKGYVDHDGFEIPANEDYIEFVARKQEDIAYEGLQAERAREGVRASGEVKGSKKKTAKAKELETKKAQKAEQMKKRADSNEAKAKKVNKEADELEAEIKSKKAKAEKFKEDNPEPEKIVENAKKNYKKAPISKAEKKFIEANSIDDEAIKEDFLEAARVGRARAKGKFKEEAEQAWNEAKKAVEGDYEFYAKKARKIDEDAPVTNKSTAELHAVMGEAIRRYNNAKTPEEAAKYLADYRAATQKAMFGGTKSSYGLSAQKMFYRMAPESRIVAIERQIKQLSKQYADRLKGKELELDPSIAEKIIKAETDDEIFNAINEANVAVWNQIPASKFEKFNELRHFSMLFNPKTHARNVIGNTAFKGVRYLSDGMEILAYRNPAIRKKLEKLGGDVTEVKVTRKELQDTKNYLNDIFDLNYKQSGSKNRYIETTRPDGSPTFKTKWVQKLVNTNYGALEFEDVKFMLRPEYRKNYVRWCKSHDIPLDKMNEMTTAQKNRADKYAMYKAEVATFRDDSTLANYLSKAKTATAGKTGKTAIGTGAYRAANTVMEGALPFVKTPVNILRRSVDYSPIGLLRGVVKLAKTQDADIFKAGIHDICTGLTGTGVVAFGAWLANHDFITVHAGEKSGDAYYDRDMGYQDFSITLPWGQSWTIDWFSPMQVPLFMGAILHNDWVNNKGLSVETMFDALSGVGGSMMDMSFMTGTKDTVETFMEKVYRNGTGDNADWSGAIMQMLGGSIPQNYLNGFMPQSMRQLANTFDPYQRDTRSTKEGVLDASWDSWKKKLINNVPVLRNIVLNPKINSRGEKVKTTGDNTLTRFLYQVLSPSTVKNIRLDKYDRKIIDLYNSLPDDNTTKKYFWYNFTGNPNYDLGDGKRMSYDELYKYGVESRKQQFELVKNMLDSSRYETMTPEMKADEVKSAYNIGNTTADFKTYGAKFAIKNVLKYRESEGSAYNLYKKLGGSDDKFIKTYLEKEKIISQAHDTSYYTKALAIAKVNDPTAARAYEVHEEKIKNAKNYLASGGSVEEYTNAMSRIQSVIAKNGVSDSTSNKAIAATGLGIKPRTYEAMGLIEKADMGAGLKHFGYSYQSLDAMKADALAQFDADGNGRFKKAEIINYIDSLGITSDAEKACLFAYFSTSKNPYGSIGNYSGMANAQAAKSTFGKSYGGSYRRSYSGRRRTTSNTTTAKKPSETWEEFAKKNMSFLDTKATSTKVKYKSSLNKAYQNRIKKVLKNTSARG